MRRIHYGDRFGKFRAFTQFRGGFGGNLASQNKTPAGKAIRAALVLTTDYLECVMVKQDGCERDFDAADDRRRAKTRSALSID